MIIISTKTASVMDTIAHYYINEPIAAGGMGKVFLAFDNRIQHGNQSLLTSKQRELIIKKHALQSMK